MEGSEKDRAKEASPSKNPPAAFATVIALSKRPSKNSYGQNFSDINGKTIVTDPKITALDIYGIGDRLKLRTREGLLRPVTDATKHVVVGFYEKNVVIQLDDYLVVDDTPESLKKYFQIDKKYVETAVPVAIILVDGRLLEVVAPPDDLRIKPGDVVIISTATMEIIGPALVKPGGNIGYVRRVIDKEFAEVDLDSSVRVAFNGISGGALTKGDRVVLESTGTIIVRNFGKEDGRFRLGEATNVSWNDIGGLTEAKRQMIEIVELPHQHPDLFKGYGKKPVKGVLLYGPPGCGKTMLGKATATSLAKTYNGKGAATGFLYVKAPEILERWVGVAEATIRQIFSSARAHKIEHGFPAVIFIDEIDAIAGKRGSGISSDMERTIVPTLLTEMDGLEESGALVILATNRSDTLDGAIVRDGRIDRKILIPRPDAAGTAEIFNLNLKKVPLCNGHTREELAKVGSDELFAPSRILYRVKTKDGTRGFTLGHIVNGGMVAGVVDQATSIALARDLNEKNTTAGGLRREDIVAAVNGIEQQNRSLNHTDELSEFVHDFRDDVVSIHRLRQSR